MVLAVTVHTLRMLALRRVLRRAPLSDCLGHHGFCLALGLSHAVILGGLRQWPLLVSLLLSVDVLVSLRCGHCDLRIAHIGQALR